MNFEHYKELFKGFEVGDLVDFRLGIQPNKGFYSLWIDRDKISSPMRDIIL